jgi:hypothetical protein
VETAGGDWTVARLNVPNRYRKGISALLSLSQSEFDQLVAALERQPGTGTKPFELREIAIPGLQWAVMEEILTAIVSLYRAWASAGDMTPGEFANDMSEAVASFESAAESNDGKARLSRILDIEPLARSSKALAVLTDNEHDYHDSKILTDIRYAFRSNPETTPYGAVIVHMLKVTYHQEAEHKSFYVALDSKDLKQLKATIERAEKKEKELKKQLALTQTHYFNGENE